LKIVAECQMLGLELVDFPMETDHKLVWL